MDIRQLRQFVHLAEGLHFGRASAACHISPSALSRSIRQLEAELGAMLFERDNRSVTLTRQGETFLAWARDVLTGWDVRAPHGAGAVRRPCRAKSASTVP